MYPTLNIPCLYASITSVRDTNIKEYKSCQSSLHEQTVCWVPQHHTFTISERKLNPAGKIFKLYIFSVPKSQTNQPLGLMRFVIPNHIYTSHVYTFLVLRTSLNWVVVYIVRLYIWTDTLLRHEASFSLESERTRGISIAPHDLFCSPNYCCIYVHISRLAQYTTPWRRLRQAQTNIRTRQESSLNTTTITWHLTNNWPAEIDVLLLTASSVTSCVCEIIGPVIRPHTIIQYRQ